MDRDAAADAFWREVVALYERDGVAAACLRAQDEGGADVLLALAAAALAHRGRRLDDRLVSALEARAAPWRRDVVAPLRALRRRWRGNEDARALRRTLKALEVAAEKRQLELLAPLLADAVPAAASPALLRHNLALALPPAARSHGRALAAALGEG